jgi:hypothetical protein
MDCETGIRKLHRLAALLAHGFTSGTLVPRYGNPTRERGIAVGSSLTRRVTSVDTTPLRYNVGASTLVRK